MVVGLTLSTLGLLWLTQLHAGSGYPALLGPLLLFGLGNGLAFVPLTGASLAASHRPTPAPPPAWSTSPSRSAARSGSPCW